MLFSSFFPGNSPSLWECHYFCYFLSFAVVTRLLKSFFTLCVNFQSLTLCLYPSYSGDCGLAEVLAENTQSQGGDVFKWAGRDPGCDWAIWICESYGALVQAVGQVRLQPTLPGGSQLREWVGVWLVTHLAREGYATALELVFVDQWHVVVPPERVLGFHVVGGSESPCPATEQSHPEG